MKPLTLTQKRCVAGIWFVVFLFAIGNEYLEWGLLGGSARIFCVVAMFLGMIAYFRYGAKMMEDIAAQKAAMRESEEAAERSRDKSNDAAETDRIRRSIGMPLKPSMEAAAQQIPAADRRENAAPGER